MSGMSALQQRLYQTSVKGNEMLGMRFCVLHNLYFYNNMMKEIREAIEEGRYQSYKKSMLESLAGGEE